MKRKLLSLLLTLALCLSLVPLTAVPVFATKASPATSLIVGGVTLDSSNPYAKTDGAGVVSLGGSESDYNIKFDASTSTLTLNNANIYGYYYDRSYEYAYGIWTKGDFTLLVNGDNTVTPSGAWAAHPNADVLGIASGANEQGVCITIGGNGTLQVGCNDENAGRYFDGISLSSYNGDRNGLTLKDSVSVSVRGAKCYSNTGVDVTGDIIIRDDANLTVFCNQACGSSIGVDCSFSLTVQDNAVLIAAGADSYTYSIEDSGTTYTRELSSSIGIKSSDMTVNRNATVASTGGKVVEGSGSEDGSYGIVVNANAFNINGGTVVANSKSTEGVSAALKRVPVLGSGVIAGGSVNADGSGAVPYVAADNDTYKWFRTPFTAYTVSIAAGTGMSKTDASGALEQTVGDGSAIQDIVFTADDGYCFPDSYSVSTADGISVTRNSDTQITVSGTPTTDVTIKLADAEEVPVVPKAPTPVFTPGAQSFTESIDVTITCTLFGATVYYTDDGSAPSATNGTVTTGAAITLTDTATLKAIAIMAGYDDSEVATATYTKTTPSSGGGGGNATPEEPEEPEEPVEPAPSDDFPFVDVPEDAYYREPVEWAVEKGVTNGVSEDEYGPELSCTRAQVVTFLWITCGSENAGSETGFDDVDVDAYYDKAVAWAVEQGITAGTSENEFSPEMTITRAQFVTMLWAAKGKPEPDGEIPFKDIPEDAYYAKAVAWAYANDITAGKSADSFAPDDLCTRGQIMTFLYNAYAE